MNITMKRTVRFIAWSGEEMGRNNSGYREYERMHYNELDNHVAVFESDLGSLSPHGFGFTGS